MAAVHAATLGAQAFGGGQGADWRPWLAAARQGGIGVALVQGWFQDDVRGAFDGRAVVELFATPGPGDDPLAGGGLPPGQQPGQDLVPQALVPCARFDGAQRLAAAQVEPDGRKGVHLLGEGARSGPVYAPQPGARLQLAGEALQGPAKGPFLEPGRQGQPQPLRPAGGPPPRIGRRKAEPALLRQPAIEVQDACASAAGTVVGHDQYRHLAWWGVARRCLALGAGQERADRLVQRPVHGVDGAAQIGGARPVKAGRSGIVERPKVMGHGVRLTKVHGKAIPWLAIQQIGGDFDTASGSLEQFVQGHLVPAGTGVELLEASDLVGAYLAPDLAVQLGRVHEGAVDGGGHRGVKAADEKAVQRFRWVGGRQAHHADAPPRLAQQVPGRGLLAVGGIDELEAIGAGDPPGKVEDAVPAGVYARHQARPGGKGRRRHRGAQPSPGPRTHEPRQMGQLVRPPFDQVKGGAIEADDQHAGRHLNIPGPAASPAHLPRGTRPRSPLPVPGPGLRSRAATGACCAPAPAAR